MKNALINIESKRIIRVKDDDFLNVPEFAEVVSISNAKASIFESSTEPMFLISNEVVSLDEKMATERQERKEERFAEN